MAVEIGGRAGEGVEPQPVRTAAVAIGGIGAVATDAAVGEDALDVAGVGYRLALARRPRRFDGERGKSPSRSSTSSIRPATSLIPA